MFQERQQDHVYTALSGSSLNFAYKLTYACTATSLIVDILQQNTGILNHHLWKQLKNTLDIFRLDSMIKSHIIL